VHFEETITNGEIVERFYPAKILGFVKFDERTEAVINMLVQSKETICGEGNSRNG